MQYEPSFAEKVKVRKEDIKWLLSNEDGRKKIEKNRKNIRVVFIITFLFTSIIFLFSLLCFNMMSIYYNKGAISAPSWFWEWGFVFFLSFMMLIMSFTSKSLWNFGVWFIVFWFGNCLLFTLVDQVKRNLFYHIVVFDKLPPINHEIFEQSIQFFGIMLALCVVVSLPGYIIRNKIRKPSVKKKRIMNN